MIGNATVSTSETRELGRVSFRKYFWDCSRVGEKNWPIADRLVPSDDPRNNCGAHFGPSSYLVSTVA